MTRAKRIGILVTSGLIVAGLAFTFWPVAEYDWSSALCRRIEQDYGVTCTRVRAAEGVFRPGSITRLSAPGGPDIPAFAELPSVALQTDACLLPGAPTDLFASLSVEPTRIASLSIDKAFSRGISEASLRSLPTMDGLTISAGPAWKQVRRIDLEIAGGWIRTLDELRLAESIGSCYIRSSCIDRIKSFKDRIVRSAVTAETIKYKFFDANDRKVELAAQAAATGTAVQGTPFNNETNDVVLGSTFPVVIGVDFIRDDIVTQAKPCPVDVFFVPNGDAWIEVGGKGKAGSIPGTEKKFVKLGEESAVSVKGSESSECNAGEENQSYARASISISKSGDNAIVIKPNLAVSGGHYRTVDTCVFGKAVGLHGEDNSARASATINASVQVGVRKSGAATMVVTWDGLPESTEAESRLVVLDGLGRSLVEGAPIAKSGEREVRISEAGLYTVRLTSNIGIERNGQGQAKMGTSSKLSVAVRVQH